MSARRNVTLVTLSTLLLLVSACSKHKKSSYTASPAPQKNAVCEGIQCLNSITWKLLLQGQVFPEKTRVDINDNTVLDECKSKQQYRIDRAAAPQSLTIENFFVPKQKQVKILVVDQGWDCSEEKTFVLKENATFEVVKDVAGSEVQFSL